MGLSIASHGNTQPPIPEEKKERREVRNNEKTIKGNTKDSMAIYTTSVKNSGKSVKTSEKKY